MRQALTSIAALAIAFLVVATGCERPEDPMLKILQSTVSNTQIDDLSRTLDFVFSERQSDQTEFNNRVSQGLNRWGSYSKELFDSAEWEQDATVKDLLETFADELPTIDRMDGSSFLTTDSQYLQSLAWLDFIANRVGETGYLGQFELYRLMADLYDPDDDEEAPIDVLFQKLNPELSAEEAQKLSLAIQLFDWVTRNIQLDPVPSYTEEEIEEQRLVEADTLSAMGLAAPGAKRDPWQLMMFARGDYIEKAKLFMALCHRVDLPSTMFATGDDEKPWAVGVLVGEKFYLFDTKMGLPILGKENNIATLTDVRADASLLSSLDLTVKESLADDTKYWVTEKDLEKITGLVYWNPTSASRRISILESNLVGDQEMLMSQRADKTIAKFPTVENVEFKPWDIALKTAQFRKVLGEAMQKAVSDDELAQRISWNFTEEGYIIGFSNYRTARSRFIRGKFERNAEQLRSRAAIESFAMLMYDDATIAGLEIDRDLQAMIGIRKADQTPVEFEQNIRSRQSQMFLVRRDAGLFMCQSHFDHGNLSTTAEWVPKLLKEQDVERWETGLNYLNARALEAQHRYDDSIEQLKAEGTQQHGNLIRVRLLKKQIETHYAKKMDEQ